VIKKIESYRVTHNIVKPVTPSRRGQPEALALGVSEDYAGQLRIPEKVSRSWG